MKVALAAGLMGLAMNTFAQMESFDKTGSGALPDGWRAGVTGQGSGKWAVNAEPTAPSPPNVLTQTGQGTFPWAVREGVSISDGFMEVKFKAISGKEDQAAGVMWRWKDGNNYYVARANALENNVSLYYTVNGRRNTIKYVKAPVPRDTWHTLRVEFTGHLIRVSLNGKTYIEEKDNHITGSGAVGLWTKADSVTAFDDFVYSKAK
jgi:FtsP/CotA-like multicopper oxidase with cupredoxin domain